MRPAEPWARATNQRVRRLSGSRVGHEGPQQGTGVNPVGLDPPGAAVDQQAGGLDDDVAHAGRPEAAMEPEAVVAGLVAGPHLDRAAILLLLPHPAALDQLQQAVDIAGPQLVGADAIVAGGP